MLAGDAVLLAGSTEDCATRDGLGLCETKLIEPDRLFRSEASDEAVCVFSAGLIVVVDTGAALAS